MADHHESTHARAVPATLADLPLPRDDTEARIPGGDLHQKAVLEAYAVLEDYAAELAVDGLLPWYVSSQVLVTADLWGIVWRHRPDLVVVPGVAAVPRDLYVVGRDGPFPPFVMEVTGPRTRHDDEAVKPPWFDLLGVREYLVFDPAAASPDAAVRAWHATVDGWGPWRPARWAGGASVWESTVLGLHLWPEGALVRFAHPTRGPLPRRDEQRRQLQDERRRRLALEAELHRLRGERPGR